MLLAGVLNNFFVARLGGPDGKGFIYTLQLFSAAGLIPTNFGIGPAAVYHFRRDDGFSVEEIAAGLLWPSFQLGCVPLVILAVNHRPSSPGRAPIAIGEGILEHPGQKNCKIGDCK